MRQLPRQQLNLVNQLNCNEFVVLVKDDFKLAENTIVRNEFADRAGGKSNGSVVFSAGYNNLRATLIIGQVFFRRNGESKANTV